MPIPCRESAKPKRHAGTGCANRLGLYPSASSAPIRLQLSDDKVRNGKISMSATLSFGCVPQWCMSTPLTARAADWRHWFRTLLQVYTVTVERGQRSWKRQESYTGLVGIQWPRMRKWMAIYTLKS